LVVGHELTKVHTHIGEYILALSLFRDAFFGACGADEKVIYGEESTDYRVRICIGRLLVDRSRKDSRKWRVWTGEKWTQFGV
uniref:Transposase n=1 Tax=Heligmosomoides polygyrus TaxID=6339 RepID=A0A183GT13_HELPZ